MFGHYSFVTFVVVLSRAWTLQFCDFCRGAHIGSRAKPSLDMQVCDFCLCASLGSSTRTLLLFDVLGSILPAHSRCLIPDQGTAAVTVAGGGSCLGLDLPEQSLDMQTCDFCCGLAFGS